MSPEYFDTNPRLLAPNLRRRPRSYRYPDISRLPNELLESIFLQLAPGHFWTDSPYLTNWDRISSSWYLPADYTGPDRRVADLVHISHVSSHWRKVALNCPILWSNIFVLSLWWTRISLARSQGCQLKVQFDAKAQSISDADVLAAMELLLSHVNCIQELRIRLYSWDTMTSQIFTKLFLAASKLRVLDLSFGSTARMRPDTPAPWDICKLGGLTTLSLRSVDPLFRRSVTEFQTILKCMPGLVHLDLGDVLLNDARDSIPSPALQKIDLPLLLRLFIIAPLSSVVTFLSYVNIPSCKQLKIDCGNDWESPDTDYNRLYPILARLYDKDRALSLPTIRSMAMITRFSNVAFVFSTSHDCDYCPRSGAISSFSWDSNVLLELSLRLPRQLNGTTLINDICASMPTIYVSDLQIDSFGFSHTPVAHTLWRIALGHLPALRRIIFSRIIMDDGFGSSFPLHPFGREHVENGDQNDVLVPELEEIKFDRSVFQELVDPSDRPEMGESDFKLPPFRDLKPFLAALSSRKCSRPRLVMKRCRMEGDFDTVYNMVAERDGDLFRVVESERVHFLIFRKDE